MAEEVKVSLLEKSLSLSKMVASIMEGTSRG